MSKLKYLPLFSTFILAAVLFLYKLSIIPSGFYVDEAVHAYSAFSILKTGKDEWGQFLPIAFRSLGFYTPPLFTYLATASIAIFGSTIFSTRLVSAIFGILGVFVVYLLSNTLFPKQKFLKFISPIIFAISPWEVLYSRTGDEINTASILFWIGLFFLYKTLKKPKLLPLASIFIILSIYTAYTERLLVPLFIAAFLLFFKKEIPRFSKQTTVITTLATIILLLPEIYLITTPAFFTKSELFYIHTSLTGYITEFVSRYLSYLSPRSLFFLTDPDPQRSIPHLATFYLWMFAPYLVGLYQLFRDRSIPGYKYLLLTLLIIPIPAAITHDPFASHRVYPLVISIVIVISLGLTEINRYIKPLLLVPILIFLLFFSLRQLYNSYFLLLPIERAAAWTYGVDQLVKETSQYKDKAIIIDTLHTQPIYPAVAFFSRFPPTQFQNQVNPDIHLNYYSHPTFESTLNFSNLYFQGINWQTDVYKNQILVGDALSVSNSQASEHFLTPIFTIKDPLGEIRFRGYLTNPNIKCQRSPIKSPLCDQLQ